MTKSRAKPNVLKQEDYYFTLEEVARELGVSRERVRQIENRALWKARQILERHGYTVADLLEDAGQ